MRSAVLVAVLVLILAACSEAEPEFTANEQVPADQRTEEVAEGETPAEGETQSAEDADGVWAAEGTALAFSDAPDTLPAGEITIALVNDESTQLHNVVFEGVEGDNPIVEAEAGMTAVGDVSLEPGNYTYYCSVSGHRPAGMEGEVSVE